MLADRIRQGLRAWERARYWPCPVLDNTAGNAWITRLFRSQTPCAIAKLGSVELAAIRVCTAGRGRDGICRAWGKRGAELHLNAGVFPPTPEAFTRACDTIVEALQELDVLGVWYNRGEAAVLRRHAPQATYVAMRSLEPYYHQVPWSAALASRKVVVLSPFAASIERQYAQRETIWAQHREVLPAFTLCTVRVPLSAALVPPVFPDWHATLADLTARMIASAADVVLIGAGAWSIPLAARAKRAGRQAIHLGGSTQLLFGIRGRRWDEHPEISRFFTPAWSRPAPDESPPEVARVEGGCYW